MFQPFLVRSVIDTILFHQSWLLVRIHKYLLGAAVTIAERKAAALLLFGFARSASRKSMRVSNVLSDLGLQQSWFYSLERKFIPFFFSDKLATFLLLHWKTSTWLFKRKWRMCDNCICGHGCRFQSQVVVWDACRNASLEQMWPLIFRSLELLTSVETRPMCLSMWS